LERDLEINVGLAAAVETDLNSSLNVCSVAEYSDLELAIPEAGSRALGESQERVIAFWVLKKLEANGALQCEDEAEVEQTTIAEEMTG
jgi:hypothetical protein